MTSCTIPKIDWNKALRGEKDCYCGKPAKEGLTFCEDCCKRISSDFAELLKAAEKTHKGAGGACMCICGAGCGGSSACNALHALKRALTTEDKAYRDSLAHIIGWK